MALKQLIYSTNMAHLMHMLANKATVRSWAKVCWCSCLLYCAFWAIMHAWSISSINWLSFLASSWPWMISSQCFISIQVLESGTLCYQGMPVNFCSWLHLTIQYCTIISFSSILLKENKFVEQVIWNISFLFIEQ